MAKKRPVVVIGLLGPTLDTGMNAERWERWRPTVAACQHPDLLVSRFELLHQPRYTTLARTVRKDITQVSPETKVQLVELAIADAWDLEEVYGALYDFARAYPFDTEREDYLVHITTGTHVAQIVLFLLTESRHLPAALLQTSPPTREMRAKDLESRTAGTWRAIDLDLSRYDRVASRFAAEARERTGVLKAGIETRNAAFNALIDRVERVAVTSRAPILLTGPTGAGKSQLAGRIYALKKSRRQLEGAFVEVNCATLRGDGAMSTLFGHTKGAFTGASGERDGLLRKADGGMLFLDEIGELGPDEQAMLLRAVEEKTFRPMGSDREVRSDFQLLAGTNRDLVARVAEGRFREDLLARIELWTFALPSLRERPEDVEPNLDFELDQCARALGARVAFSREARARFVAFAASPDAVWTGNFRDFSAAVARMATLCQGGRIDVATVDDEVARLRARWGLAARDRPGRSDDGDLLRAALGDGADALDRFDRAQLAEVIRACRAAPSLSAAGRAVRGVARVEDVGQRRRPPAQVPRALRPLVGSGARGVVSGAPQARRRHSADAHPRPCNPGGKPTARERRRRNHGLTAPT